MQLIRVELSATYKAALTCIDEQINEIAINRILSAIDLKDHTTKFLENFLEMRKTLSLLLKFQVNCINIEELFLVLQIE